LGPVLAGAPRKWSLTLVGSGKPAYVESLRRYFTCRDAHVIFTGFVDDAELPRLLAEHDCIVLPSYGEGFGLSLIEALASTVPVVASRIEPYISLARASPIRLADFADAEAVLAAIEGAIASWDVPAAIRRAREFSWAKLGNRWVRLYEALGGCGPIPPGDSASP
jgi:glycosyltransferase involved in cell wall biosynthesis